MAGDHTRSARLGQLLAEIQVEALVAADADRHAACERSRRSLLEIARLARQCNDDYARLFETEDGR